MATTVMLLLLLPPGGAAATERGGGLSLTNPVPLFDTSGAPIDAHDGDVVQWAPGGSFYYYAMAYDRCHFTGCSDKDCGHLHDHRVAIYRSPSLANRSWTLVGVQRGGEGGWPNGTYFRPHVNFNPTTQRYVLVVNYSPTDPSAMDDRYRNLAATAESPEGPFSAPADMGALTWRAAGEQLGDFGFWADVGPGGTGDAFLAYNVMGPGLGIFVERLDPAWTDGRADASPAGRSQCLNCLPPRGNGSAWRQYEESPSVFRDAATGRVVVLTAGATCFGLPQPGGTRRWGGTGIFAYVSDTGNPLGPFKFLGNINDPEGLEGQRCGVCMGAPCPDGRCALPVQLNSIARRHDGSPFALTGGMWALDGNGQVTDELGNFAEYWQPWGDVVDNATGLPKTLRYLRNFTLDL